jgi:hypothetical protein
VSPAHCSSAGQALLFDHDRAELELAFAGADLRPQGPASATDLDDLAARIEQGRNQGFAHCEGEFEEGLTSIAAPVRDGGGAIVAAVNVSAPAFRVSGRIDEIVAAVCAAASDVSQALAARGGEAAAATASTMRPGDSDSSVRTPALCSTDRWARSCVWRVRRRRRGAASWTTRG